MSHILKGLEYRFAIILYIDNIIVFSKSVEEHLTHLKDMLLQPRKAKS